MALNKWKTLVVVNPAARGGEVGRKWPKLEREVLGTLTAATGDSGPVQVMQTEESDRGATQIGAAIADGFNRLIVVGGDGTVSDVVAACMDGEKPRAADLCVGVLPSGRGDDFFKSLVAARPEGWRRAATGNSWEKGLKLLRDGHPKRLDVGLLRFDRQDGSESPPRPWVNVLSFGFPGLVVQKVRKNARILGMSLEGSFVTRTGATYVAQSIAALLEYRALDIRVEVDGQEFFAGPAFGAFVLNGAYNAGGICWSNLARLDDGLFDVLVIEPQGLFGLAKMLPQMATGQWGDTPGVRRIRGKKIKLALGEHERKRHALFDVDGDQPEAEDCRGGEIAMVPGALKVWR